MESDVSSEGEDSKEDKNGIELDEEKEEM